MGSTEQHEAFLLGRVLLDFDRADIDLWSELSAIALTPDGSLWVGSDELQTLERLRPLSPMHYGKHQSCPLPGNLTLPDPEGEIDFEGLDYGDDFLWFVGSHSQKRKSPKGKGSMTGNHKGKGKMTTQGRNRHWQNKRVPRILQ